MARHYEGSGKFRFCLIYLSFRNGNSNIFYFNIILIFWFQNSLIFWYCYICSKRGQTRRDRDQENSYFVWFFRYVNSNICFYFNIYLNIFKTLKYFDIATSVLNVARHDEGGIKKIQPYWAIRPVWQMGLKKINLSPQQL